MLRTVKELVLQIKEKRQTTMIVEIDWTFYFSIYFVKMATLKHITISL